MLEQALDHLISLTKDRLLRNAGYLLGVTVVNAASGFVFWTLAARLFAQDDVGLASSAISIVSLLGGIASLGLGIGLVRLLPESKDPLQTLNSAFTAAIVLSFVVGGLYLAGIRWWSPGLMQLVGSPTYALGFLVYLMAAVVGTNLQMAFLAYRQATFAFWQVVLLNAVRLSLLLALGLLAAEGGGAGIVASIAVALIAADLLGLMRYLPRAAPGFRLRLAWAPDELRRLIPYSAANYAADLFYRSPMLLAPPIALERLGAASSAYAYVAWMIGSLIVSPAMSLASSSFAEGASSPRDLRKLLLRAGRFAMLVTLPLAAILALGAPVLLLLFGADYAREGTTLLRWLAASAPLMAFVGLYFTALRVQKRLVELAGLSVAVAAVSLAMPAFAMNTMGLPSIGLGWLAAHALVAVFALRHFILRKEAPMAAAGEVPEIPLSLASKNGRGLVVAIPCYNEARFVGDVVMGARAHADLVVVVDDGSSDGTAAAAEAAGAVVVRHPSNLGPGAAAKSCLAAGINANAQTLVTLDGDGQHAPEEIPDVAGPVVRGEADIVIGSRFLGKSNNVARYRKFGIDVITFLYNFGARERITDGQSCFRAYSRRALEAMRITEPGFGFSVETLVQARRAGLRIREASISCLYHEESHSANPVLHGVGVALMVVKHRVRAVLGIGNGRDRAYES